MDYKTRCEDAIQIALQHGWTYGDNHKMWVIDQMLRKLLGKDYDITIKEYRNGEDGPDTYYWGEGVAP